MRKHSLSARVLALVVALSVAAPQMLLARYKPSKGRNAFSVEQEIQVGKEAAADFSKKLPLLPESDPITKYVQRLGTQLAERAPGDKWPYSFRVVNQKEINAFALPGGPIYINVGTIQAADNEAQLAGVMAHEISHVVQRHATRAATKQMPAQLLLGALGGVLGGGIGGQLAQLGISFGVGSYFLKNSREAETEADLIGADIMWDSGYDPQQAALFFKKLEEEGGGRGPQFLSDHPNPGNRAARISKEVQTLGRKSFRQDSAEFRQIKARAGGLKALSAEEAAAQAKQQGGAMAGPAASEVMPSGNLTSLQHQRYTISYPENWKTFGSAQSAVTIAPEKGVSENAVAYGVIIDAFQPQSQNTSLEDATQQLIANIKKSNPDLQATGGGQDIRVGGVKGRSVDLLGSSPIQQQGSGRERDWLVVLPLQDGSLLYLVFIAPEQDFSKLRPTYEQMLKSLKLS